MSKKPKRLSLDEAIKNLEGIITEIRQAVDPDDPAPRLPGDHRLELDTRILFHRDIGAIGLSGERARAYSTAILELYKAVQRPEREISHSAVEGEVQNIVLRIVDPENQNAVESFSERMAKGLKSLRATLLRPARQWKIELEVAGLDVVAGSRSYGGIEFFLADLNNTAELRERYSKMVDTTKHTDEEKRAVKEYFAGRIRERICDRTFARVGVRAVDRAAAEIVGRRRLRRVVDVLNFFGTILTTSKTQIYLPGDANPCITMTPAWQDDDLDAIYASEERAGPLGQFSFNSVPSDIWQKVGAARASEILTSNARSDLDERILTALQWAGRATVDGRIDQSFVLFVVSLESLLLGAKATEQVRYRFALKGTHLIGGNAKAKRASFDDLTRFYDLRSKVVHAGNTDVTESDRDSVQFYARKALFTVFSDNRFSGMQTEAEFETWFEAQLIGP